MHFRHTDSKPLFSWCILHKIDAIRVCDGCRLLTCDSVNDTFKSSQLAHNTKCHLSAYLPCVAETTVSFKASQQYAAFTNPSATLACLTYYWVYAIGQYTWKHAMFCASFSQGNLQSCCMHCYSSNALVVMCFRGTCASTSLRISTFDIASWPQMSFPRPCYAKRCAGIYSLVWNANQCEENVFVGNADNCFYYFQK